jgi:hypothetical protein
MLPQSQIVDSPRFQQLATYWAFWETLSQHNELKQFKISPTPEKFISLPDEEGKCLMRNGVQQGITFWGHFLYVVKVNRDHWSINLVRSTIDYYILKQGGVDIHEPYWRTPLETIIWYMSNVEATAENIQHTSWQSVYRPGQYPRQLLTMFGAMKHPYAA